MAKMDEKPHVPVEQPFRNHEDDTLKLLSFTPKLEFPSFNRDNPNEWIIKCCKYFELYKIQEDQKVHFASLYMVDKTTTWVASYLALQPMVGWLKFNTAVKSKILG